MDNNTLKFKSILKSDFTKEEIEEFFETNFLKPSLVQLDGSEEVSAEAIRQQRKQTQKIKNFFLTLRSN